jgi:hypothetical protein
MGFVGTPSSVRKVGLLLAICLAGASSATARAEGRHRLRLEYHTARSCPGESELWREIRRRAPAALRVNEPPSDVDASIDITVANGHVHAVVDLELADGAVQRELDGSDCAEVTRAVALIVALATDPDADSPSAPPPVPRTEPAPRARELREQSPRAEPPARLRYGGGVLLGFMGGAAPVPELYEGAYLELGRAPGPLLAPRARLSLLRASQNLETSAGKAELDLILARFAACPLRFGRDVFAEPCLTFDYGALRGRGYDTGSPASATSKFYGPGAALAAGATAWDLLAVRLDLGLIAPLARDRFFFAPDVTAHRVPAIAGYAGLALGVVL